MQSQVLGVSYEGVYMDREVREKVGVGSERNIKGDQEIHSPALIPFEVFRRIFFKSRASLSTIIVSIILIFSLWVLSPPAPGSSWTDWSHVWGREAYLKRVLEKLNLEYPHNSDD